MEDDEDLEFLRLAALKSLNNKKEAELPHISPASSTHLINGNAGHIQPIGESARQLVNDYYSAAAVTAPIERPPLSTVHHPIAPYLHSNFEKIDLNDPYVTQAAHIIGGPVFNEYQAPFVTKPSPNVQVQLSPRSAAFVLENNDILMRRKSGRSPDSPPRSHSPIPYRKSPGRWSPTPPPMAKSRSPKRSPSYGYRRSVSPPIIRRTPPYTRNRSISRSPQRRRHSPFPVHPRRTKSRSPLPRNVQSNYRAQVRSRSPIAHSSSGANNRRANSPPNRNAPRQAWRGNSPAPAPVNRNNGNHNRRSVSPRGNDETGNYRGPVRRRSRSPLTNKNDVRRRSGSRSPVRNYQRNAGVRRRRSPPPQRKFIPRNGNNTSRNNNGPLSRNRTNNPQRSGSPSNNPHRRSKSKTPPSAQAQQKTKPENNADDKDAPKQEQSKATKKDESSDNRKTPANESGKTDAKTEQQIEDELLASTNDEHSDSESDNDDDGIDLFASEESESENEGRFKLSSRQTEKPPAAVPFSKLGIIATTELRELEELRGDKTSSGARKNGRDERERDRERGGTRNAYRREPNGRYGGRKPGTDTKNRDRDSNRSWKGSKSDSRRKDPDADGASEKDRKPIMFKSTFQAVDTETRTKTPDTGTI